jgi:hypothetical protein
VLAIAAERLSDFAALSVAAAAGVAALVCFAMIRRP